jgi:hypothetical protein
MGAGPPPFTGKTVEHLKAHHRIPVRAKSEICLVLKNLKGVSKNRKDVFSHIK